MLLSYTYGGVEHEAPIISGALEVEHALATSAAQPGVNDILMSFHFGPLEQMRFGRPARAAVSAVISDPRSGPPSLEDIAARGKTEEIHTRMGNSQRYKAFVAGATSYMPKKSALVVAVGFQNPDSRIASLTEVPDEDTRAALHGEHVALPLDDETLSSSFAFDLLTITEGMGDHPKAVYSRILARHVLDVAGLLEK